jgi:hypothetical protein
MLIQIQSRERCFCTIVHRCIIYKPVNFRFLQNKAAAAGVFSTLGILIVSILVVLTIYVLRQRRKKRANRHHPLEETTAESSEILPPSVHGGDVAYAANGAFSADAAYRRWDSHRFSAELNAEDDERRSQYSDTLSNGLVFRPVMSPGGSDEYPSSSYPASTLPEYVENTRSPPPPSYSDLSRGQSQATHTSRTFYPQRYHEFRR